MSRVFAAREKAEVLDTVIQLVSVNMVNVFVLFKKSIKMLFHDKPMFRYISRFSHGMIWTKNKAIAVFIYFESAFPMRMLPSSRPRSGITSNGSATRFPRWDGIGFVPCYSSLSRTFESIWVHFVTSKLTSFRTEFFKDLVGIMSKFVPAIFTSRKDWIFAIHEESYSI